MDRILLGRISGAHGIKGWVKVFSHTEPPAQILKYSPWQLQKNGRQGSVDLVEVKDGRQQGKRIIAELDTVKTRNDAEALLGVEIWIDREQLVDPEEGEYYWFQLEGLKVVTLAGENLGVLDHMLETGANDVLVVKPDADSIDDLERLIPFVEPEIVCEIDLEQRRIVVNWDASY